MLNPFRSLTIRLTSLLVAMVAMSILVMAGLGYTTVDRVGERSAQSRIDHAARVAAALVNTRQPHRFEVRLDSEGRPLALVLSDGTGEAMLEPQQGDAALLSIIAEANQGAASFYRLREATGEFERYATTLRDSQGKPTPAWSFGPAHPAYGALVSGTVHVGQVPMMGRLRLAYFVPVLANEARVVGAMSVDIGWVDDLVAPRDSLRKAIGLWSAVLLLVVASLGAFIQMLELRPLRAIARFSHRFVSGEPERQVPGRGRKDEIGDVAEGLGRVIALQSDLERLAFSDPLTGLGNRTRHFADLKALLDEGTPAIVLLLDLDRFKEANDAYGQSAGDELLMRARDLILGELEEGDRLSRLGGDDFAIISPGTADEKTAQALARRLMARLSVPLQLPQGEVYSGCSIGIALLPRHATTTEEAHRKVELALREAKARENGPCVLFHEALNEAVQNRAKLARLLRQAIENDELTLQMQPQIDLRSGRLYGFEALARWTHTTLGPISPAEFIPVAEANGLIPALGQRVLEKACALARQWRDAKFDFGRISINVSTIELGQPNYVSGVREALARHGIEGECLCIEVTESVFLQQDEADVTALFRSLRGLGLRLSLDDFGTGYSSLGYLNRLPLDELKIDRAFVQSVDQDPRKRNLLAGILAVGKALDLTMVAEGAETEAELAVLRALDCGVAQGYVIGRPVSPLMAPIEGERLCGAFRGAKTGAPSQVPAMTRVA
ncbi:MAG: EAL domain-containing protein [Methylobacterium sp.]|nr:EAL domain-containing protein [Methylobacterium sp.]MCA3602274.1 EAL domain-containing protein [Methylobacterium sp.]MCA3615051.1 EAL domain-containing protein [Methylobacterium sp.]MCA3644572.1 EAL domain-containing protein [Methylobacterium sp.]MCA4909868.1 EAL domain-containing protein [Methylobacterium sp.]